MKHNVFNATLLVTILSTVEKALSFFYRIILSRRIGAEGVGLYNISLTVFALFLTVATGGIPITVSRLMAKAEVSGKKEQKSATITAAILCVLAITIPICMIFLIAKDHLSFLFGDSRCVQVFIILAPGLVLTSVYSVMRGVFWGDKNFLPYSLIELFEDAVMVIVGSILVWNTTDALTGASYAALAVTISFIFSFTVSLLYYFMHGGKMTSPKTAFAPLIKSSLPITATRTLSSLFNSLIALLLPRLLISQCGLSSSEATALYGVAMGMAIPILFIPSSFIGSIAVVLSPELSEHYYQKNNANLVRDIKNALYSSLLIAVPLAAILCAVGRPLGNFLYSDETSGELICRFALMLVPMCVSMLTTTVLNSLGHEKKTFLYYLLSAAVMLSITLFLTKYLSIYAYLIGMALSFIITCLSNLRLLCKICPQLHPMPLLLKSLGMAAGCAAVGRLVCALLSSIPDFYIIVIGIVITLALAVLLFYLFLPEALQPLMRFLPQRNKRKQTHSRQYQQKNAE
jgi:stage V sporulation protein B